MSEWTVVIRDQTLATGGLAPVFPVTRIRLVRPTGDDGIAEMERMLKARRDGAAKGSSDDIEDRVTPLLRPGEHHETVEDVSAHEHNQGSYHRICLVLRDAKGWETELALSGQHHAVLDDLELLVRGRNVDEPHN